MWIPCLVSATRPSGEVTVRVGHELVDEYLHFLAGRARPNTLLAAGYDLKVFFAWFGKDPVAVRSKDVVDFVAAQRAGRRGSKVVRISDGGAGLSARTVARRLSTLSGFYAYLLARGDTGVETNPVLNRPGFDGGWDLANSPGLGLVVDGSCHALGDQPLLTRNSRST